MEVDILVEFAGPPQDYVGYGASPPVVYWPEQARLALNVVVNYEEGSERSFAHGDSTVESLLEFPSAVPPTMRDLGAESIHEYGSRAGIWRLIRLFDELGIKTTFFASAVALETNPEVGAAIMSGGHEACFHGWRWEQAWNFSYQEEYDHVNRSLEIFERVAGERPYGCYWRYAPSVNSREILVKLGFIYDANAYNDDLPYRVAVNDKSILVVPYSLTYNDGKFVAATGQGYGSPSDFVDYCCRAIDELYREGENGSPKMMSIGLHPRWMGQAGRTSALREVLEYAKDKRGVWIARRIDIARWWIEHELEFVKTAKAAVQE